MVSRSPVPVTALILAAGRGRRFGGGKMMATLAGTPLVRHAAQNALASSVHKVVVVLGHEAFSVQRALMDLPLETVMNSEYEKGMSTSLHAGLRHVPPGWAAMVMLGDQPTVMPETIDALLEAYRSVEQPIICATYQGALGHPVVFAPHILPEFLDVTGDRGGRDVLTRNPDRVWKVHHSRSAPPDVDTRADLETLRRVVRL